MKIQKNIKYIIIVVFLCIAAGTGMFLYNAHQSYDINRGFTSLPLNYNPEDSSSRFNWNGTEVTVYNGFVKGIPTSSCMDQNITRLIMATIILFSWTAPVAMPKCRQYRKINTSGWKKTFKKRKENRFM